MTATGTALLAFLFISLAQAIAIPAAKECAKGPEFWCQDLQTAFQCGAVPHCLQTVWRNAENDDKLCDDCKTLIATLADMLQDADFQDLLKNYLHQGCKLIRNPSLVDKCNQLVDQYVPIIVTLIESQVKPDAVCKMLGLCKAALSQEKEQVPLINLVPLVSGPTFRLPPGETATEDINSCALCKQVVHMLAKVINSEGFQDTIRMYLHALCKLFPNPAMSSMCNKFADQYLPLIITFLQSQMDPDTLCHLLGLCKSLQAENEDQSLLHNYMGEASFSAIGSSPYLFPYGQTKSEEPHSANFMPQCTLCLFLMRRVESMIPKQTLVDLMGKICTFLPHLLSDTCTDLKDTYGMKVVEFILSKLGPATICGLLHLCLLEDQDMPEVLPQVLMVTGDCGICQALTKSAKRIVGENATEVETTAAVENGCSDSLTDPLACKKFLQTYQPQLVKVLAKPWDVDTTCKEIGACTSIKDILLGAKDCSWGPSYWCKDMQTAAKCKAVQHCKARVWN